MQVFDSVTVGSRPAHSSARSSAGTRLTDWLNPQDQELLAIWNTGTVSANALAGVMRCDRSTVHRRLRRLRKVLGDPLAQAVSRHYSSLPATHRRVAVGIFLRRQTKTQVARETSLSRRELDQIIAEIRGWARARANTNQA